MVGHAADEARLDDLPDRLLDGLAGLLVDDAEDVFQGLPVGLAGDPAGERLGHGVHVGDAALGVGRQDRVADGREGDLIPGHDRRGGKARLGLLLGGIRHKSLFRPRI